MSLSRSKTQQLLCSLLLVTGVLACGDDDEEEAAPAAEPTSEPEEAAPTVAAPEHEEARAGSDEVEPTPSEPAGVTDPPALDSVEAIHDALIAARPSVAGVWALTDPDRGLDLDFNWVMGHFVHTACSEDELATWREWAREDSLHFYRLAEGDPFHCTSDLSLCASCPQDISTCERGTVFELATNAEGRRHLYGVIMAPARSEALWDLTPTTLEGARRARVDLGSAAETGAKCAIRNQLLGGEIESLWVEQVPASGERQARHLEGEEVRDFTREVGALFDLSAYCTAERCVAAGTGELFGVYYRRGRRRRRRPPRPPRVTLITHGPPACEGCAPEPSRQVRRRARRGRRR